jgi:hypothetical protein
MEYFPASSRPPWELIKTEVDECDYYVLILAGRYGTLVPDGSVGYTEREYDYAVSIGKPVVAFCHEQVSELPSGKCENSDAGRARLEAFRKKVESRGTCKYWMTAEGLESDVKTALLNEIRSNPRPGWVRAATEPAHPGPNRGISAAITPVTREPLGHLNKESRRGPEKILELLWSAKDQRISNDALSGLLNESAEHARRERDALFAEGLANRMDNMESPGNDWIILTPGGREYVVERNIHHRIPLEEKYGLFWNDRREPTCKTCVLPLHFSDDRALKCHNCNSEFAPNDGGRAITVNEALKQYGGSISA